MIFHVSRRQHLIHAAAIWVLVGLLLCTRGFLWVYGDVHTRGKLLVLLPLALILGLVKGRAMLRTAARHAVARIHLLDAHSPFWQLFSPATYRLIGWMILLGIACRFIGSYYHLSGAIGTLYCLVGVGLLTGSATYWRASAMPVPA